MVVRSGCGSKHTAQLNNLNRFASVLLAFLHAPYAEAQHEYVTHHRHGYDKNGDTAVKQKKKAPRKPGRFLTKNKQKKGVSVYSAKSFLTRI